jgi:hypothetical protein
MTDGFIGILDDVAFEIQNHAQRTLSLPYFTGLLYLLFETWLGPSEGNRNATVYSEYISGFKQTVLFFLHT